MYLNIRPCTSIYESVPQYTTVYLDIRPCTSIYAIPVHYSPPVSTFNASVLLTSLNKSKYTISCQNKFSFQACRSQVQRQILCSVDLHPPYDLVNKTNLVHNFSFYYLLVSGNYVPIIRRNNCINETPCICHCVGDRLVCRVG